MAKKHAHWVLLGSESEHKMGEYGGFLAILECSNCAYGKHLKLAKAHEYWGLEALRSNI